MFFMEAVSAPTEIPIQSVLRCPRGNGDVPISDELICRIFSYLNADDLAQCGLVSRQFRNLSLDPQLLKKQFGPLLPSDIPEPNLKWIRFAIDLVEAREPPSVPDYNVDRQTWATRRRCYRVGVLSTRVMAGIAAITMLATTVTWVVCHFKLWKQIYKRLPNGEIEYHWVFRRIGNYWTWGYEPVTIWVPRELPAVDRAYWQALSSRSAWRTLGLGTAALGFGALSVFLQVREAGVPIPGSPISQKSELYNRRGESLDISSLIREGRVSRRVASQLLRLEQFRHHLGLNDEDFCKLDLVSILKEIPFMRDRAKDPSTVVPGDDLSASYLDSSLVKQIYNALKKEPGWDEGLLRNDPLNDGDEGLSGNSSSSSTESDPEQSNNVGDEATTSDSSSNSDEGEFPVPRWRQNLTSTGGRSTRYSLAGFSIPPEGRFLGSLGRGTRSNSSSHLRSNSGFSWTNRRDPRFQASSSSEDDTD